jgi:hypothetical protein
MAKEFVVSIPSPSLRILPPLAVRPFTFADTTLSIYEAIDDHAGVNYPLREVRSEPQSGLPRYLHQHEGHPPFALEGLGIVVVAERHVESDCGRFALASRDVSRRCFRHIGRSPPRHRPDFACPFMITSVYTMSRSEVRRPCNPHSIAW